MVTRTLTICGAASGRVNIQLMQCGQKKCRVGPCSPPITGSPAVTAKPSAGTATDSEKALALMRWQPVQWQAIVSKGAAVMRKRVCPQRHWPSQGSFHSSIARLPKNPDVGRFPGSRIHCAQLEEGTCMLE